MMNKLKMNLRTILLLLAPAISSCSEDEVGQDVNVILTTLSGAEISMDGVWLSGCVAANNGMILSESLTFSDENLQIDIQGFDNSDCNGTAVFNETIIISFNSPGTTRILFEDEEVTVNQIDGTATYADGRVENFKQVFLVNDTDGNTFMYHAKFENDGGSVDANGYPVEIIPIALTKAN